MKTENGTPITRTIDLTQDVFETRKALMAAHAIITELTSGSKIALGGSRKLADWRFTLPSDAQNELAALTAKAAALDALVEAHAMLLADYERLLSQAERRVLMSEPLVRMKRLELAQGHEALSAAKAAQVSK